MSSILWRRIDPPCLTGVALFLHEELPCSLKYGSDHT